MLSLCSLKPEFTHCTTIFFKGTAKSGGIHQIQTESQNEIHKFVRVITPYSMNSKFGSTLVLHCFFCFFWGGGGGRGGVQVADHKFGNF